MATPFEAAAAVPWGRANSDAFDAAAAVPWGRTNSDAFDAARPQAAPDPLQSTPADRLTSVYGNEFTKGLRRGTLGIAGTTEGYAAQVVEPFSTKLSNRLFDEANKTLDFEEGLRPKVNTWEDVHGPGSFFDYGLGKAGEALPSTAASLAAAGIGGAAGLGLRALTGARVPLSFAAGSLSMLPQEGGESALSLHNDPKAVANTTPLQRLGISTAKGSVNAALEFTPEALALERAFHAPHIARGFGRALAETGLGAAEATTGEAITEALQEKTGQIAQSYANPERDTSQDWQNIREAALGGAFGGVGMGAVGGGVHALRSNLSPEAAPEVAPAAPEEDGLSAASRRAGANLFQYMSNLGQSVNQKLKQSQQWSEAKGKDLELLKTNPDYKAILDQMPEGEQQAVVGALHTFRDAPGLLGTEAGKAAVRDLDTKFGSGSLNALTQHIQQPGSENVSHLGPTATHQPGDANAFRPFTGYDKEDEQRAAEASDEDQHNHQQGFIDEILPADKLGVNKDILSAAMQNRAYYRYNEATPSDKTKTDIPLRFTSTDGSMSAADFMRSLTTQNFKQGERPQTRPFTEDEIAYHTKDGAAELPISPMSLVAALSKVYKEQMGDLREGQTGQSGQRKGDLFMSALSTLMNDGISITDAEGKQHHFSVDIGAEARTEKPVLNKEGQQVTKRKLDLPDNLLIHHDTTSGDYNIEHYKKEGKKVFNATDPASLRIERELIDKFAPLADNEAAWNAAFKKEKEDAPFGSLRGKALWKIGKNQDQLHVLLGKNIRNSVANGLRTIKDDVEDTVKGLNETHEGNPSQLVAELHDYLGSDGANEPSPAVKKLFKDNNVPLFSHETLTSQALENDSGVRPQDSMLRDLEFLHQRAESNYSHGLLSQTETNEAEGKSAETANVPGIGNTTWGPDGKPKVVTPFTGAFGRPVTAEAKAGIISAHKQHKHVLDTQGAWRIEAEGGQQAGYFKTQEEAQQFIDSIPEEGYQIGYKGVKYPMEKAKKKWPNWKEEYGEKKKAFSTDEVSIINPETGEVLSLAGRDFGGLAPEQAIQYLHGINKTLALGTKLSAVDTTPMHTEAGAIPIDVAQKLNAGELTSEDIAALRKSVGKSRPLTAEDLEKNIPLQPEPKAYDAGTAQRTPEQTKLDLRSEQELADVRTQLLIERERKVDKNPELIKKLEAEEARLIEYTSERKVQAKEKAPIHTEGEYATRGTTDDFGNRVLPPKQAKELTPLEKKLGELAEEKKAKVRNEPHYTRSIEEEEKAIAKVREEKGEAAAQKERARIEALRTNKPKPNLVTGRKRAEELEAAGELEKPDVLAPHVEAHKALTEKAKAKAEAAAAKAKPAPGVIEFTKSTGSDYGTRTGANANADATLALASDFESPGEKLTKRLVKQKGKQYIPIDFNGEERATDAQIDKAVKQLNEIEKPEISLNIAGNGIVTLNEKATISQDKVDAYTQDFLERVLEHPSLKTKVTSVRTGGQTGFDEAGAKAARNLGLPVEVHAPRNWMFRVIDKTESSGYRDIKNNEVAFKSRFKESEVAQGMSPAEKAAQYEKGQAQIKAKTEADVAAREKPASVQSFDAYVKRGRYSQWYRDSVEKLGKEKTDEMSREIREYRLAQIEELKGAKIGVDGSTVVNISENVKDKLRAGVDGRISRVMVGNHGVYVEFTPSEQYTKGREHLQYNEYKDAAGNKLYEQTRKVNYADYKVGQWYVAAEDILTKKSPAEAVKLTEPKEVTGDIWDQPGLKVVSTNLGGVHGRGLALQARQKGLITAKNRDFDSSPIDKGVITLAVKGHAPETAKVAGQAFSESTTGKNVDLLKSELRKLILYARAHPDTRINLPYVGLGFGEGNREEIMPLLRRTAQEPNIYLVGRGEEVAKQYPESLKPGVRSDASSRAAPTTPLPVKKGRTHPSQVKPSTIAQRSVAKKELEAAKLEGRRARLEFLQNIKRAGGIKSSLAPDIVKDRGIAANQLGGGIFRADGHSLDRIIEMLLAKKYITQKEIDDDPKGGEDRAIDLINTALDKEGIVAPMDQLADIQGRIANAEQAWTEEGKPKESQQTTPTPGTAATPSTTHAATVQLIQSLVEKMFGKKVNVVFGTPSGATNRTARGWYSGRQRLDAMKANEARLAEVRAKRREALANNDQQEVAALDAQEQRLLKQEEVLGTIYLNPNNSIREMLPTFYHEAVHAAFDILLTPAERAILGTAFSHGTVRRQLENIFKNDAAVLSQMKEAEEAAAYGFQIYAAAPHLMQISNKLAAVFDKVLKWFRKMTGDLSANDKAEIIMHDMLSGRLADKGLSPVQSALAADKTLQEKVAKHIGVVKDLMSQMWAVATSPVYNRLIDTDIPSLIEFAKLGHTKTGEKGDLGMIQRMQTYISSNLNWVDNLTKKYTDAQIQTVADHRMNNTYPTDPVLQRAYKDIDRFFNEFRKYAQDAGVNIGFIKNYWPMLWDAAKVTKNRDAFLQMVSQPKYAKEMADLKVTPTELWENISGYVTRGDTFQNILGPSGEPANAYSKKRTLSFLDAADRKQFMHDSPAQTMANYVSHMVRQAEYVRKYGEEGKTRDALLREAKEKYGATDQQISLAMDYLDGLLGNKEVGMPRELKDVYGAMIVYQNYRLLSFNLFSSLVDPLGIAIRSGRLSDALEGFTYSLKNIFRDLKKNRPDASKDFWEKLALDWGYIEDAGTMSSLRHMMETTELRGFSKKMNDALFKWNLLNGWTRSTKIMAVKAGQRFMLRSAEGTGPHDARHLAELGLKKTDIYKTQEGNIALRKDEFMAQGVSEDEAIKLEAKMRDAMTKFVNQAILNPTAADLPNWGSNPYLAPIFHLKQFMFAFQTTIIDRIIQEAKEGNLKPLWVASIYIPGTIGAEALRGFASNFGSQPPWQKDWGPVDYFKNGYARSGLMGTGQLFASMQDDILHGGSGYESLLGPTVEQFKKGLTLAIKGDTSMWNFIVKSMPLNQIYDQWLMTSKAGSMGKHFGPTSASATSE